MKHIRQAHICTRGTRAFAAELGVDFSEFLKNGYPLEEARKIDNAFVQQVADIAEAEANGRE